MMALDLRVRKDVLSPGSPGSGSSSGSEAEEDAAKTQTKFTLNIPQPLTHLSLPITSKDLILPPPLAAGLYPQAAGMSLMGGLMAPYVNPIFAASTTKMLDSMASHRAANLSPEAMLDLHVHDPAVQREISKLKDDWNKCRIDASRVATLKSKKLDGSRGVGWTTIGDIIIPYIMRGPSKYVSVRVVETKLLSTLQGVNLDKMNHAGPLYSYYITDQEARLFTEINTRCYNHQFGIKPFTTQDLIVSLAEFERFYQNLKKQCGIIDKQQISPSVAVGRGRRRDKDSCNISTPPLLQDFNDTSLEGVEGGWVQINNTVVPYVFRNGVKFVPLSIIKYAAGLLTDVRIDGYKTPCTEMEYKYLNSACKSICVDFEFIKSTNFIKLELVIRMSNCKVTIKELPKDNPFSQAIYQHHVRDQIIVFPLSSSPDLAPNQNPAVFQIPSSASVSVAPETFGNMFTPVTAIASHALQFFNASTAGPSSISPLNPDLLMGNLPIAHDDNGHSIIKLPTTTTIPQLSPPPPHTTGHILADPTKKLKTFSKQKSTKSAKCCSRTPFMPAASITSSVGQPNKIVIECVDFHNKTLPCLQRGGIPENSYVLVESVMRLYFPNTTLEKFLDVLQGVMDVSIIHLKSVEEQAFIRFYNLPVKAMRYKFMMLFAELQRCFEDLKSYFSVGVLHKSLHSKDYTHTDNIGSPSSLKIHSNAESSVISVQNNSENTDTEKNQGAEMKDSIIENGESLVCFVLDNTVVKEDEESIKESNNSIDPKEAESKGTSKENTDLQEERQALLISYDGDHEENSAKSTDMVDESPFLCKGAEALKEDSKSSSEDSNIPCDTQGEIKSDTEAVYSNGEDPPALTMPKLLIDDDLEHITNESPHIPIGDKKSESPCGISANSSQCSKSQIDMSDCKNFDDGNSIDDLLESVYSDNNDSEKTAGNKDNSDKDVDMKNDDNDKETNSHDDKDKSQESSSGSISPGKKRKYEDSGNENSPPVTEKKVKASGNLLNKLESALAKLKKLQKEKLDYDQSQ